MSQTRRKKLMPAEIVTDMQTPTHVSRVDGISHAVGHQFHGRIVCDSKTGDKHLFKGNKLGQLNSAEEHFRFIEQSCQSERHNCYKSSKKEKCVFRKKGKRKKGRKKRWTLPAEISDDSDEENNATSCLQETWEQVEARRREIKRKLLTRQEHLLTKEEEEDIHNRAENFAITALPDPEYYILIENDSMPRFQNCENRDQEYTTNGTRKRQRRSYGNYDCFVTSHNKDHVLDGTRMLPIGYKHQQNKISAKHVAPVSAYFSQPAADGMTSTKQPTKSALATSTLKTSLNTFCTKSEVLRSEILWTMKCIHSHYSMNSCKGINNIFKAMFPDSKIAEQFSCSERKTAYLGVFGIAPFFADQLLMKVREANLYVLLFDETLNKDMQEKQMDLHVRIWDCNKISTYYLTSEFLGHARAEDLVDKFEPILSDIGYKGLLQLSMDGPAVNWKLYDLLQSHISHSTPLKMLEVGSCGLHVMHNAFRSGCAAVPWDLETLLSSVYHLYHDSPARRQDFMDLTGSTVFPLKYCKHRWLENIEPVERVIFLLPHLADFCSAVKNKKITVPGCKSFKNVLDAVGDPLIKAKLQFFVTIARITLPFLEAYQTDKPMLPFLATDLGVLVKDLMSRYVKPEIMSKANSVTALMSIGFDKKENFLDAGKVNVGFSASQTLLKAGASDRDRFAFRTECRDFMIAMVKKLFEKSPLKYPLVKNMSWADPGLIQSGSDKEKGETKLRRVLRIMCEAGREVESRCDLILTQYGKLVDEVIQSDNHPLKCFSRTDDSLDEVFYSVLSKRKEYVELWNVLQKMLLLSHGQATVERGFSINKQVSVENLSRESLRAERLIIDTMRKAGGPLEIIISNEMMTYASSARHKYHAYLDKKKAEEKDEKKNQKGKKRELALDEVEELKAKKLRFEADIASLHASSVQKAEEAELKGLIVLVTESNALRRRAEEKMTVVASLSKMIEEKKKQIK